MTKTHEFHLAGAARKPLIDAIESFTNVKGVYQGAPKFGYAFHGVGVLDKEGALHFDCDAQVVMDCVTWLEERGFSCDSEPATDNPESRGAGKTEIIDLRDCETAYDAAENGTLSIEIPLKDFSQTALGNLGKLINSKRELIKTAIGNDTVLPVIQTTDGKLRFEWFPYTEDPDEVNAYAQFISLLCETAKAKKRVIAKERPTDNMKFAMRVWLISLGMVGRKYTLARRLLTKNLPGNSAFSKGSRPVYTANCYIYPNGSEEDAMDCDSRDFPSLAKAKAHCDEFLADCESVKFAGAHVEDEDGNYVYTILTDGTVETK